MEYRLQVLGTRIESEVENPIAFYVTDIYGVAESVRHAALDALIGGAGFPFVLVDGAVVCTDGLDADAIVACLKRTA